MNKYLWGLMTLLAVGIAGYAITLLAFTDLGSHSFLQHHYHNRPIALFSHLGLGSVALVFGAFQFHAGLRKAKPVIHRWIGRLYVTCCLASGIAGFSMALASEQPVAKWGFMVLAIVWIVTTSQGFLKARARNFGAHKQWMIRSYAATYAAVTLRFLLPIQLMNGVPFETAFLVVSWACWVPNMMFAEWIILRRRKALLAGA